VIDPPDLSRFFFSVYLDAGTANSVVIGARDPSGALADGAFTIAMLC
jgi:hypothetical protein